MTGHWRSVYALINIVIIGFADVEAKSKRNSYDGSTEGDNLALGTYPWHAALYKDNFYYGNAVIIGEAYVLTTASLVFNYSTATNPGNISIVVGRVQLNSETGEKHTVQAVVVHPGYRNKFPFHNDLAILKLTTAINFDETKQAVKLPEADIPVNTIVTTTGWIKRFRETVKPDLKSYDLKIIDNADCALTIAGFINDEINLINFKLLHSQVCTDSGAANWNCTFQGNIGAPLVHDRALVGITSTGDACYNGPPAIHSRIYDYVDWINHTMRIFEAAGH